MSSFKKIISKINKDFFYNSFDNLDYSIIQSKRTTYPVVKIFYSASKRFYFDISSGYSQNNIHEKDLNLLIEAFKYALIHIVIVMYKKESENSNIDYGKLFQCLYKKFYGVLPIISNISDIQYLYKPGLYINWKSSCYLDSLLVIIFFSTNSNILNEIIQGGVKENHMNLRNALLKEYNSLTSNNVSKKCINIRKEIMKIIPHDYVSFSASEVYNALSDVFIGLRTKIPRIAIGGLLKNAKIFQPISYELLPMIPMWDFMDISNCEKGEGSVIQWDLFDEKFIVFQNTLAPALKRYNDITSERTLDEYKTEITKKKVYNIHKKGRIFGEYILNKKYKLSAVIMQLGKRPSLINDFDDGHYTAFIRSKFSDNKDQWFYYDDLSHGEWDFIGDMLPETVFLDSNNSRPELLFYEKIIKKKSKTEKILCYKNTWRGNKFDVITL